MNIDNNDDNKLNDDQNDHGDEEKDYDGSHIKDYK